jgi:hypothetical protein
MDSAILTVGVGLGYFLFSAPVIWLQRYSRQFTIALEMPLVDGT